MNPKATSREAILEVCRGIVRDRGLSGISVRSVASACGVAPGTLYNYFPGKNALLLAVTADVWSDIFTFDTSPHEDDERGFDGYLKQTFENARAGMKRYPGFLPAHMLDLASKQDQRAQYRPQMWARHRGAHATTGEPSQSCPCGPSPHAGKSDACPHTSAAPHA